MTSLNDLHYRFYGRPDEELATLREWAVGEGIADAGKRSLSDLWLAWLRSESELADADKRSIQDLYYERWGGPGTERATLLEHLAGDTVFADIVSGGGGISIEPTNVTLYAIDRDTGNLIHRDRDGATLWSQAGPTNAQHLSGVWTDGSVYVVGGDGAGNCVLTHIAADGSTLKERTLTGLPEPSILGNASSTQDGTLLSFVTGIDPAWVGLYDWEADELRWSVEGLWRYLDVVLDESSDPQYVYVPHARSNSTSTTDARVERYAVVDGTGGTYIDMSGIEVQPHSLAVLGDGSLGVGVSRATYVAGRFDGGISTSEWEYVGGGGTGRSAASRRGAGSGWLFIGEDNDLMALDPSDGSVVWGPVSSGGTLMSVEVSPDGDLVAFSSYSNGSDLVIAATSDGTESTRTTGYVTGLTWAHESA